MEVGTGKEADGDDFCEVSYQMFTQNGLYLDSVGYGQVRRHSLSVFHTEAVCCMLKAE